MHAFAYIFREPYILASMLEFVIEGGRPDIIDHLLDLGADPHLIDTDADNHVHKLINDSDIEKKVIKKMEKVFKKHGYDVNLHDTSREYLFD